MRSVELCVEAETGLALADKRISSVRERLPHVRKVNAFFRGEGLCWAVVLDPAFSPPWGGRRARIQPLGRSQKRTQSGWGR